MYEDKFRRIAQELAKIFSDKQKIYGNAYFQEPSEQARYYGGIYRKLYRLNHFMQDPKKHKSKCESIQETYKDLAIYSIMALIYYQIPKPKKNGIFKKIR